MFDLSWSHILIFLVVALVVVGPKDMPLLLRKVGGWVGKAKSMAGEFQKSFDEMAQQSDLDELRQEIERLRLEKIDPDMQPGVTKPAATVPANDTLPAQVETSMPQPQAIMNKAAEPIAQVSHP